MRALVASVVAVAFLFAGERVAYSAPPLFSSYELVTFRLEAPFDDLFAGAKQQPEYAVAGRLIHTAGGRDGTALPVSISLRGHTSRRETECTFPKLKVSLKEATGDTGVFEGVKTLKIGTHCGELADDTLTRRFGRVQNQNSPLREAAVYRLLDALGVPALRARPARISYVYSDAASGEARQEPLVRHAMLLEDDDAALERIGAAKQIEAAAFTSADRVFNVADLANLAFAEALIGNFDWCLKFTPTATYRCDARMKLWNIIAAAADGGARPLIYDFDVSGMVTGSHRWFPNVFNAAFSPSKSQREVEVVAQLQRTRSLFARGELDAARSRFGAKKRDVYRALDQAEVDDAGRRQMRDYLDAFYREIESDERFYRPVVVANGMQLRAAADPGAAPVCTSRGAVPLGTPVSEPLETSGEMIKVIVLDALWHWAPPAKCVPVQNDAVWIDAKAISRQFPKP